MTSVPRLGLRLVSWWWDYLLIVAWLAVVFVLVGIPQLIGWWDLSGVWANQLSTDVAITILTVVPYFLYLVLSEGRAPHATWGKRRAGLGVISRSGRPPGLGRSVHQESGQGSSLATGPYGRRPAGQVRRAHCNSDVAPGWLDLSPRSDRWPDLSQPTRSSRRVGRDQGDPRHPESKCLATGVLVGTVKD